MEVRSTTHHLGKLVLQLLGHRPDQPRLTASTHRGHILLQPQQTVLSPEELLLVAAGHDLREIRDGLAGRGGRRIENEGVGIGTTHGGLRTLVRGDLVFLVLLRKLAEQATLVHHVQSLWHHGFEPFLKGSVLRAEGLVMVEGVEGVVGVKVHCVEDDLTLLLQVVLLGTIAVIGERETGLIEIVRVETGSKDLFVEGGLICQVGIFQVTLIEGEWISFFGLWYQTMRFLLGYSITVATDNTDVSPSIGIKDMSSEEAFLWLSITEVVVVPVHVHDEGLEGLRLNMLES